jgi:hypothetical protein
MIWCQGSHQRFPKGVHCHAQRCVHHQSNAIHPTDVPDVQLGMKPCSTIAKGVTWAIEVSTCAKKVVSSGWLAWLSAMEPCGLVPAVPYRSSPAKWD